MLPQLGLKLLPSINNAEVFLPFDMLMPPPELIASQR